MNYGRLFVFNGGNNPEAILTASRSMVVLLGVALGAVLFLWSRRLHGADAGLLSLAFYCLSPLIIANSAVATTDIAATLLFTLSILALWRLLHWPGPLSIGLAGLAVGALAATKISGLMIAPIALALLVIRMVARRPMTIELPWLPTATARPPSWLILLGNLVATAGVAWAVVWMVYGFRYSAAPNVDWGRYPAVPGAILPQLTAFSRQWHILPESYLFDVNEFSTLGGARRAFLLGQYSIHGWWYFFPVLWLAKNPLPFLLGLGLATMAAWKLRRKPAAEGGVDWYGMAPLLTLGAIYGVSAVTSNLNIGVRHLLPLYPTLLIFAGLATRLPWSRPLLRQRVLWLLAFWSGGEALAVYPHYLAYFNEVAGGSANGYKIAVDSSYEWGEELPAVQQWMALHEPTPGTKPSVYFSYFGCADLSHYGINDKNTVLLPQFFEARPFQLYDLGPGTYLISATMLKVVYDGSSPIWGPWSAEYEKSYQELRAEMGQLAAANNTGPATLEEFKKAEGQAVWPRQLAKWKAAQQAAGSNSPPPIPTRDDYVQLGLKSLVLKLRVFDYLRFSRLCSHLRQRAPDGRIAYGIMVYTLDEAELNAALQGPSPETAGSPPPGEADPLGRDPISSMLM